MDPQSRHAYFRLNALNRSPFATPVRAWSVVGGVVVVQDGRGEAGQGQAAVGPMRVPGPLQVALPLPQFPFLEQDHLIRISGRERAEVGETDWDLSWTTVKVDCAVGSTPWPTEPCVFLAQVAPDLLAVRVPGVCVIGGGPSGRWMAIRREGMALWVSDSAKNPKEEDVSAVAAAKMAAEGRLDWFHFVEPREFFQFSLPPYPWWFGKEPVYLDETTYDGAGIAYNRNR